MDDAVNMGGIGVVIGHELTQRIRRSETQVRSAGQSPRLVTSRTAKSLRSARAALADEYGSFVPFDDLKLNGRLTLGKHRR